MAKLIPILFCFINLCIHGALLFAVFGELGPLLNARYAALRQAADSKSNMSDPSDCICSPIYDPVCGTDEKSYYNVCQMQCEAYYNVTVNHPGNCIPF